MTAGPAVSMLRASAISTDKQSNFIRGYGFEGSSGTTMIPGNAFSTLGFGSSYKKAVRDYAGAYISMGAFGEVLPRYENAREHRSGCEGQVGRAGAPVPLHSSATTRRRWRRTWP